ncbi:MAG TPA: redoxin domain-containing protein [Pirellulales bacterium]|nr:redoxin domain-containing protein [Pirellulales bacterium]
MLRRFLAPLLVISSIAGGLSAGEATGPVGRKVENFSLRDYRGKVHELTDFAENELVVAAFIGCECPLAKLYAPRLVELAEEFGPRGIAFVAIDANSQDSLAELAAYAQAHKMPFPVLKDAGNAVADQMGAVRTPEVFVLDRERTVRYWGRIDDQYVVGRQRPAPTREDLKLVLEELLAGKSPSVAETAAIGCYIGRVPKQAPHGDVTYSNQIARLLEKRCVECHRAGEIAPFPLTSYEEVVGWGETIREVVEQGRMPPWFANPEFGHFVNDARLSDAEKQLICNWLDGGSPEGDPADLPEPRKFAVGWQIPEPDQVIYIRDEPYEVPAEGVVAYQYFKVDPGFEEDRWIKAAEARPDNRGVVHHIVAFFVPPGAKLGGGQRGAMIGYAPGMPPTRFPEGVAMLVPAGSQLIFQLHYTPNGSPQKDRSSVGLIFADPAEVKQRVGGGMAPNRFFEIPPGDDNYEVASKHQFNKDVLLLNLTPHMHLRGKSFRYEAEYPDGRREVLLDIPHYDFNWQLRYQLAVPKVLPKGTTLFCTAHFDNSADNLANPDPTTAVRWGDQTWDEMMIGYFSTLPVPEPEAQ